MSSLSSSASAKTLSSTDGGGLVEVAVEDGTMIVGSGLAASGTVEGCENFITEGHFEGKFSGKSLDIRVGGSFTGDVTVETASIAGEYKGNLIVSKSLKVLEKGRVEGEIRYAKLDLHPGAFLTPDAKTFDKD